MKKLINYLPTALLIALFPVMTWAQSASYTLDSSSSMIIKGTSTIHDWEANVETINADIKLEPSRLEQDTVMSPVESLAITVPVKSIDSGKGRMDGKIYDALKEEDHPQITFKLNSAEIQQDAANGSSFTLQANGALTIAGVTKNVTFPVKGTKVDANSLRFEGSYGLNMKDYDMDPPSAMFGTIKSGEEVDIEFNILVTK